MVGNEQADVSWTTGAWDTTPDLVTVSNGGKRVDARPVKDGPLRVTFQPAGRFVVIA